MTILKSLLGSKKFLATLVALIVVLADKIFGFNLPEDTILQVVGLVATFVLGQGIAATKATADPK